MSPGNQGNTAHAATGTAADLLTSIWTALDGDPAQVDRVEFTGSRGLKSAFPVSDLAAASFGAAGLALATLTHQISSPGDPPARVRVDRELASGWFYLPIGPSIPINSVPHGAAPGAQPWMTEFRTADDRWLRVQMVFPRLRRRVIEALRAQETAESVAAAIQLLKAEEAEQMLIDAGAAVAVSRSLQEWRDHPQGRAVAAEPIVAIEERGEPRRRWTPTPGRPLAGLKVLDLTRVVAGPMATRFLAACGAEVLRLEAPGSDESDTVLAAGTDLVLGKRWAYLDIGSAEGRARFLDLLADADVLVHGYRPGAIDRLVSPAERQAAQPGLVEVAFNAYGWTGPWAQRRGFDSLVQYSSGLADETQRWALEDPDSRVPINALGKLVPADRPRHLPVEAIDFATGYQVAAAAIAGLTRLLKTGRGSVSRLSLARTAALLADAGRNAGEPELTLPLTGPVEDRVYTTPHGPVRRLRFPVDVAGAPLFWERPYEPVGSSAPRWTTTAGSP
jgi:crotonobetainyl-CoA:carnitine CoA-transferase CaiB-like acyl-CoA transferase